MDQNSGLFRVTRDWQAFIRSLDGVPATVDPLQIKHKSQDFHWFSPILKETLRDRIGDILVTPRTEEELLHAARTCVEWRVPVTVRGAGTGNYGQAVPLQGGVILDMTYLNRIIWIKAGGVRAQSGIKLCDLETAALAEGWELRLFPSTKAVATLGGFVAGGSSGVGGIRYGLLREPGNIHGLRVLTLEDSPRFLELRGRDINKVNHAYGSNGIILELEMPLSPAYRWLDAVIVLDDFMSAVRFGQALAEADGIVKNECGIFAWPVPRYFKRLKEVIPEGKALALCQVAELSVDWFHALAQDFGGSLCYERNAHGTGTPLYEYTWNHTTLHAIRCDPSITYLQSLFGPENLLEAVEHMYRHFGDEMPMHLEFVRLGGKVCCFGIQLLRYSGEARLQEIIGYLERHGVPVFNPHTHILEDGGMKVVDPEQLRFKRLADPYGLLNPGKMRGWWEGQAVAEKPGALYP